MEGLDPGLEALYQQKKRQPYEAAATLANCKNLILGMSAAQPPALMAATADALRDRLKAPLPFTTFMVPKLCAKLCWRQT